MGLKKVGNIRQMQGSGSSTGVPSGMRKVGNIRTGVRAAKAPEPRPDIKQSVNYKNAILNAEKYAKESEAANANVAKWQGRADMPKEILKTMARAGLGVADVALRTSPIESVRNAISGANEVIRGDKNVPLSIRAEKGFQESKARPLMWEKFTGNSVTKPEGGVDWEQGRKFVADAASAPTYAYTGSSALVGNPTGNIVSRILKRTVGSIPEAAVNTGIQQVGQGNMENVGTNFRNNLVAMSLFSNAFGEGGRALRKVSDAVTTPKGAESRILPQTSEGTPQNSGVQTNNPRIFSGDETPQSPTNTGTGRQLGGKQEGISYTQGVPPKAGIVNPVVEGPNTRGFTETMTADPTIPKAVYEDIPGYAKSTDKSVYDAVAQEVGANPRGVMEELIQKGTNLTREETAKAQLLMRKFIADGDIESAKLISRRTSTSATETARALEILSNQHKLTPEGAFRDVLKRVDDYNAKNPGNPIDLTPEKAVEIQTLAGKIDGLDPASREWQVAAALLEKAKAEVIPVSWLGKLSKLQTMAQLLNPKTLIRNLGGNTAMDVMEDASRVVAAGIDKALFSMGFITERNVVMPNVKTNWMNKMTGFKMGVEDANLGIRTSGSAGKYDIISDAFESGSTLNKLEKMLGYSLGAPDKAFYHGRYMSSLENIMEAKGVDVPTPIMREMADAEALYATFQNNSAIAKGLSATKRGLNAGKEWGLGDLLLKYPKTPGNIVSAGLDYSPIGFVKGLKQFYDSVKILDPVMQRESVLNLSRGITGTGLIFGGAMMAKQGIITADPETDPDIRQLKREAGQGPFSLNLSALGRFFKGEDTKIRNGDTIMNYDWLQPNAIQLSMGANMILNKDKEGRMNSALESLGTGFDTINEQPIFSGVKRFVSNLDTSRGGGFGKAVGEMVAGAPTSFTPSVLNQVGQVTDNTSRETYDPSIVQSSFNKVKARIPGLREELQPRVGTMGQEMQSYQNDGNSLFNVFLNPAFVKTYDLSPVAQEVIDIYTSTGETKQAPRIAPKTLKIDGESYRLSPVQYTQYQTFVGQNTDKEFQKLLQDPAFHAMSDSQKADTMSSVLTKVAQAGREELALTGVLPKSSDQQAKDFLRSGDMDGYKDFVLSHPELNTKADFTRLMNELKKESFNEAEKAQYDEILKRRKEKTNKPFYTN